MFTRPGHPFFHWPRVGLREAGSVGDRGPSHLGTAQQCAQRWVQHGSNTGAVLFVGGFQVDFSIGFSGYLMIIMAISWLFYRYLMVI